MKAIYDPGIRCRILCIRLFAGLFLTVGLSVHIYAQDIPHPVFKKFKGKVLELAPDSLKLGYRPYVEALDPVDTLIWDEIMVRVRKTKRPFPDVDLEQGFGILFYNQMLIKQDGYYEFILASDDGSKLWIDGDLIVDNDLIHPMRVKRDSILLRKGIHPIKLWYYQAMHDKYGFIFQGRFLSPLDSNQPVPVLGDPIVWEGDILFEFDHHELSSEGFSMLDSLIETLDLYEDIEEITVMGHTDDVGPIAYNEYLSQRRASSILDYLSPHCERLGIKYQAVGYGEEKPRVPNTSAHNRAKNRRVEFLIK